MANQVRIGVGVTGAKAATSEVDQLRAKFDKLTKTGAKGFAIGVGAFAAGAALAGLGTAASMATDFIQQSINASRDLSETLSKSKVVFGDSAKDIEAWGSTAAVAMGLSKQAAIEMAANFGGLFVGLGQTKAAAAAMSKGFVALAGDLASFNNMDPTEVLAKLQAGLAGETEPLRSLGVFLTAAKVKAKAMEMGLKSAHGELSEGDKVLARYQLILDETATAQGDFARTSQGLANSQRSATAQLIDAQAELGASFQPLALQVTKWQVDFIQGLGVVGDAWKGLEGTIQDFNVATGRVAVEAAQEVVKAADHSMDAIESKRAEYHRSTFAFAQTLPLDMNEARKHAVKVARKTPGEIADALRAGRDQWQSALDQLKDDVENKMSRAAEIAKLKAILAGKRIAQGLRSQDPVVRAAAAALERTASDRLAVLQGAASRVGTRAARDLARAIQRGKPGTAAAARLHEIAVKNALGQLPSSAYGWGKALGRNYASGIKAAVPAVKLSAAALAQAAARYIKLKSPAEEGPLSGVGPEGFGRKLALDYAKGMRGGAAAIASAASGLAGAASFSGAGAGGGMALGGAASGGAVHIHFHGLAVAPTQAQAKQLADTLGPAIAGHFRDRGLIGR